jgi:hypothetical protein
MRISANRAGFGAAPSLLQFAAQTHHDERDEPIWKLAFRIGVQDRGQFLGVRDFSLSKRSFQIQQTGRAIESNSAGDPCGCPANSGLFEFVLVSTSVSADEESGIRPSVSASKNSVPDSDFRDWFDDWVVGHQFEPN